MRVNQLFAALKLDFYSFKLKCQGRRFFVKKLLSFDAVCIEYLIFANISNHLNFNVMKKLACTFVLCLAALLGLQAQVILKNNKFWDGEKLYTAQVEKNGVVVLKGLDIHGNTLDLNLKKNGKRAGEYTLQRGSGNAPYGCVWGCRVQYIKQSSANFLAFYVEEHTIGQVLVQTSDNLVNCVLRQEKRENQTDPMSWVSAWPLNQKFLSTLHPEVLQGMENKLLNSRRKTIVETTNQQLIAYALAAGLYGLDAEGDAPEANATATDDVQMIAVTNEQEFLAALGSNRVVRIVDNTTLNLSKVLEERENFEGPGLLWTHDYYDERSGSSQLRVSCERFDGRQLELVNIHNLTIRGGKNCTIVVRPRYANVLNFYSCSNIRLENITLGHTEEEGYCEGGVIYVEGCEAIAVTNCDLYGCGTYGLEARQTSGLVMENTVIRDCSYGIMQIFGSEYCSFIGCDFVRCREYALLETDDACRNLRFFDCRFAQNQGSLFSNRTQLMMENCEIHHAGPLAADSEPNIKYLDKKTRVFSDNNPLSPRKIGPQ